jgi:FAD:protein FMN transferase
MHTQTFEAMGSRMTVLLDSVEPEGRRALARVPGWFEEWEATLSRFRPDSELNRVTAGGRIEHASGTLCAVVREALRAAAATDGLVNPLVRDALVAAGYDRSFEQLGAAAQTGGNIPDHVPDWRGISCNSARREVDLPPGARLDLGGIAKGWAADRAADRLSREGPALVEAGGDLAVSGPRADGSPWPVGVANPFGGSEPLCTIALNSGGVATSGRDYRRWTRAGEIRHHIIDPRTGASARTDVLTATVAAPTAGRAEAAAKAALILGSEAGIAWLEDRPNLAGMLVLNNHQILYTRNFPALIWQTSMESIEL